MTPGVEARMIAMFRRGETAAFKREQLAAVREIERGGLIAEAVAPLVGEIKRLRAALTTAYTLMVERGAPQEDVEPWLACLDTLAALAPKEADPAGAFPIPRHRSVPAMSGGKVVTPPTCVNCDHPLVQVGGEWQHGDDAPKD